ncbi:T9SS type A sorting domain-containing protein [Lutibacter sp.]|uniref:T9SS type A sorting domain-containing protein n=1 Tax=Lutibacter sp. TaxID=1925666 RepID=UPI0025C27ABC|nr:T9SS type A sorting domain-containing protein [Lutibacter sp.]
MSIKIISTSNNLTITTINNALYLIEISTYLGSIVYKDHIKPKNNKITIRGLNSGKYIIHISNNTQLIKQQINILKNNLL